MEPQEIKKALPRTWHPFFSRFGSFTPIQEMAIPFVLNGDNVVVISPSASGKTEAVIAPVLENMLQESRTGLKVLYVTPTRALVNDLFRRLEEPISSLSLTIGRKTGDHPTLNKDRLPNVLLTTPESFDSLVTRAPAIFPDLFAVILDEIHLLDNTPRGDQLRILLIRLRKIMGQSGKELQYCALSATIDDLNIGERYFEHPRVCYLKSPREIEEILIPAKSFLKDFVRILIARELKKVLAFFNARSYAESFSRKLDYPPFEGKVFVHHASLPRAKREEVERVMNQSERAILLATSTLELGIDIGDIDAIVLYRPPYNVSSLLQRVGRGNRRTDKLFAIGVYANNWERFLFETFFECARQGTLYEKKYQPLLSVIPQQIYSYLYQRRRIGTTTKSLCQLLGTIYPEEIVKSAFKKLYNEGIIKETKPGVYQLGDKLETKISYGKIHSNIAEKSFGEYDVFDISTGILIGRIFYLHDRFILGGRCWAKVNVMEKEKKVYARFVGDGPEFSRIFEGKGAGNYNYLFSAVLKNRFFPQLKLEEYPCFYDGKNTHIIHLFGSLYGFIIAEALCEEGIDAIDVEGKILTLNSFQELDQKFPVPRIESIIQVIESNLSRFEDALGSGAFFYDLPIEQQIEDHFRNLDINGFVAFMNGIRLSKIEQKEIQTVVGLVGAQS